MKFKFIIVIIILAVCLVGCSWPGTYYSKIEQNVSVDSIKDDTYLVCTYVWIYNWFAISETIEKSFYKYDVACEDIPAEKTRQMAQALIVKAQVDPKLKIWKKCKY